MRADRYRRMRDVLCRRQLDLTVLMENVHKPHNYSAVLRTCDAVGIAEAHAISTDKLIQTDRLSSASAAKWVDVRVHSDITEAMGHLGGRGFRIIAAHFSERAVDFRDIDYTQPTALLLGQEREGVTPAAADAADEHVIIPMEGLVQSLNVSVANAVVLLEAQRQRRAAGSYERQQIADDVLERTLFEWLHPGIARWCREHDRPYPPLDDEGEMTHDFRDPSES